MKKKDRILLLGLILAFISACATSQQASIPNGNPEQLVSQLETDLADARADQVDVLAPGLFADAQAAFNKAQKALDNGAKISSIGKYVSIGSTSLKKAVDIAKVSRTILADTNKAREKALKVGADRLGKPYDEVNEQYLKLTRSIENDNLSYAQKNAVKVQAAFQDVEIMAIKDAALGNARQMMAEADKANIRKISPQAYGDALRTLNEADAAIGQSPYAEESISESAARSEFMAQRMISIHESSRKFAEMTPEQSALFLEEILTRVGRATGAGELRDKGVENQINALTDATDARQQKESALEKENQAYQSQIADLRQQLAGLEGYSKAQESAKQRLAAEREFNERFNRVQRYFGPEEAEVYKQGSQLVIRLRGIRFPVGQATLTPDNYTLLSKVQKAIGTFEHPTVTIEGHTDSSGAKQMNQELSQKRAQAVKTYLVANKTLPEYRIRAAGYGPDRPLAPNTTAEGRAINRRIDVRVTPAKTF